MNAARKRPAMVMLIEDDRLTREIVAKGLMYNGFEVVKVGTAHEAVSALTRCSPDCILADLILPDGDGIELARRLGAALATENRLPPIIAISASLIDRERAVRSGAFVEVLTKPVEGTALADIIRGHIRRRPTDPALRAEVRNAARERIGAALGRIYELLSEIESSMTSLADD